MKKHTSYIMAYFVLLGLLLSSIVAAQPDLTYDLQFHTINYKDNDRVQEFRIPTTLSSGLIYFEATGGDGGRKRNGSLISAKGGQGARMGAWFEIGTGSNQIPPGSEVIFIVGQRGESINNAWAESAGGGGGTAVFYKRPDNQYTLLLVAGGGNGGYSDCCTVKEDGNPGEIIQCPISGTDSYCSFTQLACGCYCYAGGGGIYDPSSFEFFDVQDNRWEDCNSKRAGHLGWPGATNPYTNPVKPTGGLGGNWDVQGNTQKALGGFGFGGGAGGGGLWATQSNGGGFTPGGKEKGGGSFINNMHFKNRPTTKEKRGSTNSSQNGQITYRILPSAPNIVCNNLTVYLDQNGTKTIQASEIGAGSSDPNGLELTYTLYDINTQRFAISIDAACADIGTPRIVTLFASNILNGSGANSSTCAASLTIKAKPFMKCKDATVRLNTSGQGTLEASNINDGSSTICGETISSYTLSKSSFGCTEVGHHTVTLTASDNNGDTNSCTANVQVVDPNPVVLRCKDITVDIGYDGDFTLEPSEVDNGTGNVCGRLSYTNYPQGYSVSPNTFDCSHLNTTQTVTLTLTGPGGSTGTCTSQVRIEQDQSEFAKCKDITVTLNENGEIRLRPWYSSNIDDDTPSGNVLCIGAVTKFELSKEVFTCADIGPNSVTLTVKRGSTFIDDCTATVTVVDETGPVIQCPPLRVQLPTDGNTLLVWADDLIDPSFSDKCTYVNNVAAWLPSKNPAPDVQYTLTINTDTWPNETSWSLTSGGQVLFSGGPYNVNSGSIITETFSLSPGRYTFNMYDEFGDGLNVKYGNVTAGFRLEAESGEVIMESEPNDWDYQKSKNFYVGIRSLYYDRLYFECVDLGNTYPLSLIYYDQFGRGSTCETTVTIEQDLSEAAKCKDVTVTLDQSGQNQILARKGSSDGLDFDNGSIESSCFGNHGLFWTPNQTNIEYSCADIGANPVTLSITKPNGDIIDECISTVTVLDKAGPVAKCQPLTIQLPSSGTTTLTGADLDAGSYDVCGTINSRQVWNSNTNPYSEKEFALTIQFEFFSSENSWTVTSGENTYASGGPYTSAEDLKLITETFSLPPGCYELNFYDSFGDGFRFSGPGNGYFHLKDDQGNILVEGADDWDYQKSGNFCVEENAFSDDLTFDCTSIGTHSVMLLLKDNYGNGSYCSTNVTVEDNSAPTLVCKDITVPINDKGQASITAKDAFDSSSGCGLSSMTLDKTQFDCSNLGQNTVTLTGIGQNGISGSCTAKVTVTDPGSNCNQAPVAVCQDITVSVDENCQASIKPSDVDGGSNDPDGDELIMNLDKTILDRGAHTIILTISDGAYTDQCTAVVTVKDATKPIPDIPSLPTINAECTAFVQAPTATDNCLGTITAFTNDPNNFNEQGTYTITWIFEDDGFNRVTQTQTVIVNDVTKPIPDLATLPTITSECSANVSTIPTATDNCEGTIQGTTSDPLSYSTQGTHTITWSFDDGNGNVETQTQTVIVKDISKPVPEVSNLPTLRGECGTTVSITPTAVDNCTGQTILGTTSDPLTYTTQGTHTITWSFDDGNGNVATQTQTVIVDDVTDPVLDLNSLPVLKAECSVNLSSAPTATDNCAGTIIGTTTDPLSYGSQGTHLITWIFDDGNGNSVTQTQTVIIKDVTAPVPDIATLPTITGNCEAGLEPPFATDNCAGQVIGTTSDPLYFDKEGTYTITWIYDDGNGNTSSQDQTIVIEDDIAPVPDRNNLPTLRAQCGLTVSTIPTATDRCLGTIQGTTSDPLTYNTQGIHLITWTYDDGNGNSVTQTQRVVIRDNKAPVPNQANLPALTGSCSVMITHFPTATDNCAGSVTATTDSPLEFDQEGTFAIVWNYDDGNGNTSVQTQWVIVGGDAAPNALCKNISMPMTGNGSINIKASDIDDGSFDDCSQVTLLISPAGGSIFGTGLPPAPSMDLYCKDGKEQNLLLSVTNEKGSTAYCQAKVTLEGTDSDSDGLLDSCDNCPDTYNLNQKDSNNNGTGDACEENANPDPSPGGWGGWSLKKQGQEENNTITELKAFPNPFQEQINLSFNLSHKEKTTIEIFNIQGQQIHTLLSEMVPAGDHRVLWDGKDQNGQPLPAGVYLVRLRAGKALINQKVVLQK